MQNNSKLQKLVHRLGRFSRLIGMLLAACLLAASLLTACATAQQAPTVGNPAPEFTLDATGGGSVSLSEYKDVQPVLLYFHMAVG